MKASSTSNFYCQPVSIFSLIQLGSFNNILISGSLHESVCSMGRIQKVLLSSSVYVCGEPFLLFFAGCL